MKVCVVGAGFSGLSIAYNLTKSGVDVDVYEAEAKPGGMALGFKKSNWKWSFERHYHHWFVSDWSARKLAEEIGQKYIYERPKSSTFINDNVHQLDSPVGLMLFDELSLIQRIRTGVSLAYLKALPFWKTLEETTAKDYIEKTMGGESWSALWKPLFEKKFGKHTNSIPASWFWARIKKRSASLGYPVGGFLTFAEVLESKVDKLGGKFYYKTSVDSVKRENEKFIVRTRKQNEKYDKVVCTLPSAAFVKIVSGLPDNYKKDLTKLKGLGAVNLVLSLKSSLLDDGSYWLNINQSDFPFVAVVEHTNFMDKKYYNGENLIYVGNYVEHSHRYFESTKDKLLEEYLPYLKKINDRFSKDMINDAWVFDAYFAQPIIPLGYSNNLPDFQTPINGLFLCNIQQVYPWDRGTNYAVENGKKVADMIINET